MLELVYISVLWMATGASYKAITGGQARLLMALFAMSLWSVVSISSSGVTVADGSGQTVVSMAPMVYFGALGAFLMLVYSLLYAFGYIPTLDETTRSSSGMREVREHVQDERQRRK
jgi:hypothetical protein